MVCLLFIFSCKVKFLTCTCLTFNLLWRSQWPGQGAGKPEKMCHLILITIFKELSNEVSGMGRTIQSLLLRFSRVLLRFADKNGCLISFPIFIRSYFTCNVYLVILKYLVREWRVFGNKSQHACIISVGISLKVYTCICYNALWKTTYSKCVNFGIKYI